MERKRRAQGEGSLFQRSDGLWVAAITYYDRDGKRRSKRRASKDYVAAVNNLRDLRDEVAAGVVGSTPTVAEWLDYWLEEVKKPELAAIVGHSDIVVTRGYQHADLTLRASAVAQLDALLSVDHRTV